MHVHGAEVAFVTNFVKSFLLNRNGKVDVILHGLFLHSISLFTLWCLCLMHSFY